MTPAVQNLLLGGSAFLAGAVNSLAGGGTLLTYPALLAVGISPIHANATSTLSLMQGQLAAFWGYRKALKGDRRLLFAIALPSMLGAIVGALLLLSLSEHSFAKVAPWLILAATALFLLSDRLHQKWRALPEAPVTDRRLQILVVVQLMVAVYGGFFGAGQSILMLATLGLCGMRDLDRMNGLKNFAAACINSVAAAMFIAGRLIEWRPVLLMAVAAIAGGYAGALCGQRIDKRTARRAIIAVGVGAAAFSFWKTR